MNDSLANRLRELRVARGMERHDLSVPLGVTEDTIRRLEVETALIPSKYLGPLTTLLDCTADHLLGLDREPVTGKAA